MIEVDHVTKRYAILDEPANSSHNMSEIALTAEHLIGATPERAPAGLTLPTVSPRAL